MAKIAGRKNEGAWQLFNNWLARIDPQINADFEEALEANPVWSSGFDGLCNAIIASGLPLPDTMATLATFTSALCAYGFPLDVFVGKTAYDYYIKTTVGQDTTYEKQFLPWVQIMSTSLRYMAKLWQFGQRQLGWFAQDTHPPTTQAERNAALKADRRAYMAERVPLLMQMYEERRQKRTGTAPVRVMPAAQKKMLTRREVAI